MEQQVLDDVREVIYV